MIRLFFSLMFCGSVLCYAQDRLIQGVVVDAQTNQPIAFAAVGIVGSNVGTVTTEEGLFRLAIPSGFVNDSLTFSEVVHKRKKVPVTDLLSGGEIVVALEEAVVSLRTVEVSPANEKRVYKNLGVKPMFYWGSCYANFKGGAQIAQLMEARDYPVFLSSARIKIGENTLGNVKIRVRIVEKDENELPGSDLFVGDFKNIGNQTGWVVFDLSYANIMLEADFFVCFEFLNVEWQPTVGYFSIVCSGTDTFSKKQFVRMASLDKWQQALPGQKHIYTIGAEVFSLK